MNLSSFWVLLAAVLWGTTGTAQAFAPASAHPVAIGAMRLALGGIPLLIVVLSRGNLQMRHWPLKELLLAAMAMACYQPFFFSAVSMTGVAIGTVVAIGSAPILSGLLEWLFMKSRPTKLWWGATLFAIIGCLLMFADNDALHIDPLGIVLALGAGLAFAGYTLLSGKLVQTHSSISIVAVVFTLSALFLSPFLFIYDMSWVVEGNGVVASLHLGLIATGLAYFLFSKGLIRVPSSTAVTLTLAEPLTATLLGVFLVGEHLDWTAWVGIGFLILGIGMLIPQSNESPETQSETASG